MPGPKMIAVEFPDEESLRAAVAAVAALHPGDIDSLAYAARIRTLKAIEMFGLPPGLETVVGSVFIDAFTAGVLFERKRHE